ncbi:MAG: hypothetical protein M3Q79_03870 [bacterium]|nr:hypothetical protein [bacterium]
MSKVDFTVGPNEVNKVDSLGENLGLLNAALARSPITSTFSDANPYSEVRRDLINSIVELQVGFPKKEQTLEARARVAAYSRVLELCVAHDLPQAGKEADMCDLLTNNTAGKIKEEVESIFSEVYDIAGDRSGPKRFAEKLRVSKLRRYSINAGIPAAAALTSWGLTETTETIIPNSTRIAGSAAAFLLARQMFAAYARNQTYISLSRTLTTVAKPLGEDIKHIYHRLNDDFGRHHNIKPTIEQKVDILGDAETIASGNVLESRLMESINRIRLNRDSSRPLTSREAARVLAGAVSIHLRDTWDLGQDHHRFAFIESSLGAVE